MCLMIQGFVHSAIEERINDHAVEERRNVGAIKSTATWETNEVESGRCNQCVQSLIDALTRWGFLLNSNNMYSVSDYDTIDYT